MDALIGRYRVRMEASELILTYPAGISFDLTLEETVRLNDFLNAYRQTLTALAGKQDRAPDSPGIKAIILNEDNCLRSGMSSFGLDIGRPRKQEDKPVGGHSVAPPAGYAAPCQ